MTAVAQEQLDHVRKPIPFLFNWGITILVLVSVNFVQGFWPISIVLWMIIGSFTWMGIGCVINAARCGRLHCYFSGPIFLIGALATFLVGFGFADLGSIGLSLSSPTSPSF
jgi:hypothetical protein